MHPGTDRAWMEVDLDVIESNYKALAAQMNPSGVMAVVKADSYGLGALPVSKALAKAGCPQFAVACMEEAAELRDGGISSPILLLGPCPEDFVPFAAQGNIMLPVVSLEQGQKYSLAAERAGVTLRVHIKVDVGLSRFGLPLYDKETAVRDAEAIFHLPHLEVAGVFTQYTVADLPSGDPFNRAQIALFQDFCRILRDKGYTFAMHSAASDFATMYPESRGDFVRIAALLLGLSEESPQPSVSLRARIYQIKNLPAAYPVGYGPTYHTLRPTRLAVVPIGYADGLSRRFQKPLRLMVHGRWAPVIGKVCMDYLMLDITDIPNVQEGDIVTLFGRDGGVSCQAYELAAGLPGTVGEITSIIPSRVPRLYTRGGQLIRP